MRRIQVIEIDGRRAYVVPADVWQRIGHLVEDAEDAAVYAAAVASDDGLRVPAPVAFAIADGTHPVRAWREHKGMTVHTLAAAAGVSAAYVSQIESGKRSGTTATLKKLAAGLELPVGLLLLP